MHGNLQVKFETSFHCRFRKKSNYRNKNFKLMTVTPMGVCYELRLHEMADYMKVSFTSTDFIYDSCFFQTNPFTQTNSVLGLIMAVNLTDITFGWHGFRSGVGVYYYHWTQPQSELRELSLTADMIGLVIRICYCRCVTAEKLGYF